MGENPHTRASASWPALIFAAAWVAAPVSAAPATECTAVGACYCINSDFREAIAEKIAYFRKQLAEARAKGKATGYLSIPLSTAGGAYFGVNREVARQAKERVEARLGPTSSWVLDPTAKDADLPTINGVRASQADYLLMWTRVLEGPNGLGEDFDFVYFAGPTDFASYFGLTGKGDLDRIAAFYEDRLAKDPDFKRAVDRGSVTPASFRNYYVLRASAAFSVGAHDEWNVIRTVNARRRDDAKYGVPNQLPVLFDGRAASSAEAEQAVTAGNVGACRS